MTTPPLQGRRILAVEDEYYLAMELERDLVAAGAHVLGPVPSIEEALALIESESRIDVAVLDINLGGRMSYPVAEVLMARAIPFVITSGYVDGDLASRFPDVPCCEKPIDFRKLIATLASALR